MKKILLCLLFPLGSIAQSENFNYEIEGNKVFWRKVFENISMSADSLQKSVKRQILTKGLKIDNEEPGLIQARFQDYLIGNQGIISGTFGRFEYNASVSIEFKEGKYRVEQSEIITYFVNAQSFNSRTKMTEESQIMKANGTFRTANGVVKQMSERNKEFISIFKLKPVEKKDW